MTCLIIPSCGMAAEPKIDRTCGAIMAMVAPQTTEVMNPADAGTV
jgi:hypothetical protein